MIRRTSPTRSTGSRAPVSEDKADAPSASHPRRFWPIYVLVVLVLCVIGFLTYERFNRAQPIPEPPAVAGDIDALVEKVARHTNVPAGERPTIATVEDADLLRQQQPDFYRDAQNGDKLLVWSDRVVLYSVSRDIVLETAPLNVPAGSASSTASATSTATTPPAASTSTAAAATEDHVPTIEVRNGTGTAGLAKKASTALQGAGFTTLAPSDAKDTSYTKTVYLIKAGASFPVSEPKMAGLLKAGPVAELPGERASTADILVILGTDYQP